MTITYQYPPELFSLLVDAIAVLCKSKKDVLLFFRGAGVSAIGILFLPALIICQSKRGPWHGFRQARCPIFFLSAALPSHANQGT